MQPGPGWGGGWLVTATVAEQCTLLDPETAVSVYVVVVAGETRIVPDPAVVSDPTFGVMLTLVALLVVQVSVDESPC